MTPDKREDTMADQTEQEQIDPIARCIQWLSFMVTNAEDRRIVQAELESIRSAHQQETSRLLAALSTVDSQVHQQAELLAQRWDALATAEATIQQQAKHIEVCEYVITEHSEFGGLFQPQGRFYEQADLLLGGSAVVEGGRWLVEQFDALTAENAALRDNNAAVKAMFDERAVKLVAAEATITSLQTAELELNAVIASLTAQLAECYRLSGADPDGDEDWRLAEHAVAEVRRLREESDADGVAADTLRAERDAAQQTLERCREVQQTTAEAWRIEHEEMTQQIATLTPYKAAFDELYATVQGECPSLLDPCRGGSDVLWNLCAAALASTRPQEQP